MNKTLTSLFLISLFALHPLQAVIFNGAGGGGFGGPISDSTMEWTDDGSTINVTFTKGTGGDFNDQFVIYLDTGASGRTSIPGNVDDNADPLRNAISFNSANAVNFSTGFEATHAIAIDTSFGGLWSIPASGAVVDNGLGFVTSVSSTLTAGTDASFTFSFDVTDIGLTANGGATIDFVATYGNASDTGTANFWSNEGYGGGFPGSNLGDASDITFSSNESYTIIPEPGVALLFLGGLGFLALWRRRNGARI